MQRKLLAGFALGAMMFGMAGVANATLLQSNISTDNIYNLYLSTSDNIEGSYIGSGIDWMTTYTNSMTLNQGQDYYLHVQGLDQGGPGGFLGSFSLTGTDHQFANGTQTLLTNVSNWQVSASEWSGYTTPTSWGDHGVGPWGTRPIIPVNATWIWTSDNQNNDIAYFSTKISATTSAPTPEPASMMLLGTGIAALAGARKLKKQHSA